MSLALHLSLHVLTALLAGYIVWRLWRYPALSFGAAFFGAVLIDLDHFIDYFLAFGLHFSLPLFLHGDQFGQNDKIYVLFHGWEYGILLLGGGWLIKKNARLSAAFLALSFGTFFHLLIDVNVNDGMTYKSYSAVYRAIHNYEMKEIVTPEHYKNHLEQKYRENN